MTVRSVLDGAGGRARRNRRRRRPYRPDGRVRTRTRCPLAAATGQEWLEVGPGSAVLDVGCGPGDVLVALAGTVAPGGRSIGLDRDPAMLTEARRRAALAEVDVDFIAGDVRVLGFPDAVLDACRAERVLQHLPDPEVAIAQMVRALRPGGRLVTIDSDWWTRRWHHPDQRTTRAIVRFLAVEAIASGDIGSRLAAMYRVAGLVDIRVEGEILLQRTPLPRQQALLSRVVMRAVAGGFVTDRAGRAWLDAYHELIRSGDFFCSICMYAVAGRKANGALS
ncbi:MAG: methyltransferase domain-containing protein [Acidimicrobiia bacterium]